MRKIYSCIIFIVLVFNLKAQYLTSANNPLVGEVENLWNLDTAGLPFYTSSWNYSNITITPSTSILTNSWVAPSAIPNGNLFGSANRAKTSDNLNYVMYDYTPTDAWICGYINGSVSVVFQFPAKMFFYPFSGGLSHSYSSNYTYSNTPVTMNGTVNVESIVTQTLYTPWHNYANVVQVYMQTIEIANHGSALTHTTINTSYSYYHSSSKFSLLTISKYKDTVSNSTVVTKYKKGVVSNAVVAGIKQNYKESNFSVYPNPSSDKKIELYFVLANEETYIATIYNALGQLVKRIELGTKAPGIYNEIVNLETLQSGVYYLHLNGNKQDGIQKIIIQ